MKLIFAGSVPSWVVVLGFLGAVILTILVYRQHRLPRPWSLWLPGLRIAALALLLLTLLQPVLARFWETEVRGQIGVVIDNSGSMSVRDRYTIAEQIRVAWRLRLFPPALRTTAFETAVDAAEAAAAKLTGAAAAVERETHGVAPDQALTDRTKRALRRQRRDLNGVVTDIEALTDRIVDKVTEAAYLQAPEGSSAVRGYAVYQRFADLPGHDLETLRSAPGYPTQPTFIGRCPELEAPANVGENYGARIAAFLHPPVAGNYTFICAADDRAELRLSTSDDAAQAKVVARVDEAVASRSLDARPEQRSAAITLDPAQAYYLEVLFKEASGQDHCAVGWVLPDGTTQMPIPGAVLSPAVNDATRQAYSERYDRFRENQRDGAAALQDVRAQLELISDSADAAQQLELIAKTKAALTKAGSHLDTALNELRALQQLADRVLAGADIAEVDDALAQLRQMTRLDIARFLLQKEPYRLIERLTERGDVEMFSLAEASETVPADELDALAPDLNATRIGSVIHRVANRYGKKPVAGILLLSDGNNNAGKPLTELHELLADRRIPLFAVGIGNDQPPPDVAIERVLAPSTAFKGDSLAIQAVVRRPHFTQSTLTVRVLHDGEVVHETEVPPGPQSVLTVDLSFVEEHAGRRNYVIDTPVLDGEALARNNRKAMTVNVLTDPIRALLIDHYPRWESRYANMMLDRDPRIDVTTVFIGSTEDGRLPIGDDAFPGTSDGLFAYHILVLGDVDPQQFNAQQTADMHAFVVERGGTLIAMAGPHFMPALYRGDVWQELLPLSASPGSVADTGATVGATGTSIYPVQLAPQAEFEGAVQIGHDPAATAELWQRLPAMSWVRHGVFAAEHANVYVTGPDNVPVAMSAYAGLGKVLYLGSDTFWRWRYRARWRYHHRFWGQILLWATLGRTSGDDPHIKLMTDHPAYSPGDTVTLRARVLGLDQKPLVDGTVSALVNDAHGETVRNVKLLYLAQSGGEYRVKLQNLPRGSYRVQPRVAELDETSLSAACEFEIRDLPTSEYIELACDRPGLQRLADEYRSFLSADEIVAAVPEVSVTESHRRDTEIWDSFYLLIAIALLLGLEWQLRKKAKLI